MQRIIDTGPARRAVQRAVIAAAVAAAAIGVAPAAANVDAPAPDARCASRLSRAPGSAPRLHVALTVEFPPTIPNRVTEDAIAEVASIWTHYGVDVFLTVPSPCGQPLANVVSIRVITSSQRPNRFTTPLGAIEFSPEGTPGHVITVFYDDIVQFALHGTTFSPEPQLPPARREQVIGRVLGRVLAHELGHFLLSSPLHADAGLMRSVQPAPDLSGGPLSHFLLSAPEAERLDRLLESEQAGRQPPFEWADSEMRSGKSRR